METARIARPGKLGLQLPAFIRNVLLADCGQDWDDACKITDAIQARILEADWIELDDTTCLEVTWTPRDGRIDK